MYEHFKNEYAAELSNKLSPEQMEIALRALDRVVTHYEITEKTTEIAVVDDEIPNLVKTYLVCKKIDGLSEKTLYNYGLILKIFFEHIHKLPEDVQANDIRMFLYEYQSKKGISNRSLDKTRMAIHSFYQWAQDEEYIQSNPARNIKSIKYEAQPRQSLSQIELEYIRKACRDYRDRAIVELLYSTGCRVSELVNIKISDLDLDGKKVHLVGKGRKHRDSFINAKAEVAIEEYIKKERKGDSEYLITGKRAPYGQITKHAVEDIIKRIAKESGLDKKITPHVLRHTTATTALQNGMPVESIQIMLGHSRIDTTMIYAHSDVDRAHEQFTKAVI